MRQTSTGILHELKQFWEEVKEENARIGKEKEMKLSLKSNFTKTCQFLDQVFLIYACHKLFIFEYEARSLLEHTQAQTRNALTQEASTHKTYTQQSSAAYLQNWFLFQCMQFSFAETFHRSALELSFFQSVDDIYENLQFDMVATPHASDSSFSDVSSPRSPALDK